MHSIRSGGFEGEVIGSFVGNKIERIIGSIERKLKFVVPSKILVSRKSIHL